MHRILNSELLLSELKEFFNQHPNGVILNAKINDSAVMLYNYSYTELLDSLNTRLQTNYANDYFKSFSINLNKGGNYNLNIQTQPKPLGYKVLCNEINNPLHIFMSDNFTKELNILKELCSQCNNTPLQVLINLLLDKSLEIYTKEFLPHPFLDLNNLCTPVMLLEAARKLLEQHNELEALYPSLEN